MKINKLVRDREEPNRYRLALAVLAMGLLLARVSAVSATEPDPEFVQLMEELSLREAAEPMRDHPRWKQPERVVVAIPASWRESQEEILNELRAVAGDAELIPLDAGASAERMAQVVRDTQVFLGWCSPRILEAAPRLLWLHNYGVGVDQCALDSDIARHDFVLTNAQRLSAPTIAEHVVAMMMMLNRNLHHTHRAQVQGRWDRDMGGHTQMTDLQGKTVLVAGLGGIGTEVARRSAALGMRVIATRNSRREGPDFVEYVGLSHELHELAGRADVIVNALPLTKETTGIFDKRFFDASKRGAFFITVGRGKSTVTEDLVEALKDGRVGGAGLDVTDPEPLPPDHELWAMENIIITPHVAGRSSNNRARIRMLVRENLRRYVAGEKLLNVVDIQRGY